MDPITDALALLNAFAQKIGGWAVGAIHLIVPAAELPADLAVPIGWLALLTAGLAAAEVAKRFTWIVVGVGWVLIAIRIVMGAVES
jgi:hypothetical protein